MASEKTGKTTVTMVQDANGVCRSVRIGSLEIPVLTGMPIPGVGQMNFTLTIGDVEIAYARTEDAAG